MPKQTSESKAMEPARPSPPDLFREFDHALHEMERRMDRLLKGAFDGEGLRSPLLQGLLLQPGPDGRLSIQPFGHLQEPLDRFGEGVPEPALSWRLSPDGKALELRAEVPGLRKGDLDVQVHPDYIQIEGRREEKGGGARYSARCQLGRKLQPDGVDARCEDGVLTVRCRLAEPAGASARRVEVR